MLTVLRFYQNPHQLDAKLAKIVQAVMPLGIIIRLLMAILLYGNILIEPPIPVNDLQNVIFL